MFRWKNCTRAETLVQFFPRKIERINRPTRHVLLQKMWSCQHEDTCYKNKAVARPLIIIMKIAIPKNKNGFKLTLSIYWIFIMTSSNGNIFRVTGPSWEKSTVDLLMSLTKASDDADHWCFLWSAPEQTIESRDLRRHGAQYDATLMFGKWWRLYRNLTNTNGILFMAKI